MAYRFYAQNGIASHNVWVVMFNAAIAITGSIFQECMVRGIKKRLGYYSTGLYLIALPMTFYNIIFSDYSTNVSWGNMTSLALIFGLAFLLSAQVLGISFNITFINFSNTEIENVIKEVKQNKSLKTILTFFYYLPV